MYPEYYLKPFHAYDEGNLSWLAAMEVESAALSVHSRVYPKAKKDGESKVVDSDPLGDFRLRDNFHKNIVQHLSHLEKKGISIRPKTIVDIGCSTGLSTFKLAETFPQSHLVGVDASPFMLSGMSCCCRWIRLVTKFENTNKSGSLLSLTTLDTKMFNKRYLFNMQLASKQRWRKPQLTWCPSVSSFTNFLDPLPCEFYFFFSSTAI